MGFFDNLRGNNKPFDYTFKIIGPAEHEIILRGNTVHRGLKWVFEKAMDKTTYKTDYGVLEEIKEFRAKPETHKLLKTAVAKELNKYYKDLKKRTGIVIMTYDVDYCDFRRNGDIWDIEIRLTGLYTRKKQK